MDKAITETIGVDLGDRRSSYCVLDQATGEIREEGQVESTPQAMGELFARFPSGRAVLEAGGHSPWVSRIAAQRCAEALVANPRALAFIYGNHRKSDRVDARALAKVARVDTSLLSPVVHRSAQAQADLALGGTECVSLLTRFRGVLVLRDRDARGGGVMSVAVSGPRG